MLPVFRTIISSLRTNILHLGCMYVFCRLDAHSFGVTFFGYET